MKKSMILLCVVVSTSFAHAALAEDTADLILVNGRVYTVEQSQPWAEALAIKGEWLLAVGSIDVGKSDPKKLLDAKVLYMIAGGKVVYELLGVEDGVSRIHHAR